MVKTFQFSLFELGMVLTASIFVAWVVGLYMRSPDALEFLWSLLPPGVKE